MLFRQLFDQDTCTYTYLVADAGEAVLIDPVLEQLDQYLRLLNELNLTLVSAIDTHVHADHISALGPLREQTEATTYVGNQGSISCADHTLSDRLEIALGGLVLSALYTPGHTDDSYSFYLEHNEQGYLFTGDTLLIRGTGRTDFQNGNALQLYHSLHEVLMKFPNSTFVYPGHDYKGWTRSTIGEERLHNPRLLIADPHAFESHMASLNLPSPRYMDVAVPRNKNCGNPLVSLNQGER